MLNTFRNLNSFDARHQGALQAYLRQAVANRIRDEIRRTTRRPAPSELRESHLDPAPSPLERAIGREEIECYETALAGLRASDREAHRGENRAATELRADRECARQVERQRGACRSEPGACASCRSDGP